MAKQNWKDFLDSIDPLDEFCFHKPPARGETEEQEIERLQLNLAKYREYMKNNSTFPREVHDARMADLARLRELQGR